MRVAILDADTLVWVLAYHNRESEDAFLMLNELDRWLAEIFVNVKADKYVGFLQGTNNFRVAAFPDYKANRPPKPDWYKKWAYVIVDHLVRKWKFEMVNGMETDDAVASASFQLRDTAIPIICSSDKDLKQVEGWLYNTGKKELTQISPAEAHKTLMLQILTGDATDNIKPIKRGIGPVKALKMLDNPSIPALYGELVVLDSFIRANDSSEVDGLVRFAENVLQVVLRRDKDFKFTLNDVPDEIKKLWTTTEVENQRNQTLRSETDLSATTQQSSQETGLDPLLPKETDIL